MSDPQGPTSGLYPGEVSLNPSAGVPDFLSGTAQYFEAWRNSVQPSLDLKKNHLKPTPLPGSVETAPNECRFEGRLEGRFEGTLRLEGYVTGSLSSLTGTLIISESGQATCDINAATVLIEGFVRGNIFATQRVVLGSHARVLGNITSAAVSIAPGAVFEGNCNFLPPRFQLDSEGDGSSRSGALHSFPALVIGSS